MGSGLGFFEVPVFGREASTSYKIRDKDIKVELLTPLTGPESSNPVYIKAVKAFATPLRYLDYLIKDPVEAVIVAGRGVFVNVPQPSRYAVHKLVLSQRRRVTEQVKSIKDLNQAACLIEILLRDRPGDFDSALTDARDGKSEKFKNQMIDGLGQIDKRRLLSKETLSHFRSLCEEIRG